MNAFVSSRAMFDDAGAERARRRAGARLPTRRSPSPPTISSARSSDLYFSGVVKDGGFGKFMHRREPTAIARQTIIRMNRDTLYSAAVFDLDAGPVTIALPDPGKRFLSMQVIDEDEYSPEVLYGAAVRTLTRDQIGTRYALVGVRILVNPDDPKDVETVHALQDAIEVSQPGGPGKFAIPNWDASSQVKVRNALLGLGVDHSRHQGHVRAEGEVDPVRHLIGSAAPGAAIPNRTPSISTSPRPKRRQGGLQTQRQERSGGRLLVDQRL